MKLERFKEIYSQENIPFYVTGPSFINKELLKELECVRDGLYQDKKPQYLTDMLIENNVKICSLTEVHQLFEKFLKNKNLDQILLQEEIVSQLAEFRDKSNLIEIFESFNRYLFVDKREVEKFLQEKK